MVWGYLGCSFEVVCLTIVPPRLEGSGMVLVSGLGFGSALVLCKCSCDGYMLTADGVLEETSNSMGGFVGSGGNFAKLGSRGSGIRVMGFSSAIGVGTFCCQKCEKEFAV